jgi:hypothetical protein
MLKHMRPSARVKPDTRTTIFNFQENINIHVSQVLVPLIVRILNILELNDHLS